MRIGQHSTHPAADVFPLMSDDALSALEDDIECNGQLDDIVLIGELILDGRNRYQAIENINKRREKKGEELLVPRFTQYAGEQEPSMVARYVWAKNGSRRDLSPGARAICARRLLKIARVRKPRNQPTLPGVTEVDHAADAVLGDGCDELVVAVERGEIDLDVAAAIAKHEPEQQRRVLEKLSQPEKPVKAANDNMSVAIEITEADRAAIRAGLVVLEQSKHGIVRACAALVRRMVRGV